VHGGLKKVENQPGDEIQGIQLDALKRVENRPIILTQSLLEWMGCKGRRLADKQFNFSKLLKIHNIPYNEIDHKNQFVLEYPCVQKEIELIPKTNLVRKKWICMYPRDFKKAIMRLNTENAEVVRDYYLNLEEAMFAYGEYTMNYFIDKTEKQLTIKDISHEQEKEQLQKRAEQEKERLQKRAEQEKERAEQEKIRAEKDKKQLQERLEQEKESRLKAEKEAEEHRQYALVLKELTINDQKRPLNEIIYISTSKAYANQNRFKVGGVEGMTKLKSRFAGYNGRSSIDDEWYYPKYSKWLILRLVRSVSRIFWVDSGRKNQKKYT
jgi:hypothetical protein